MAQGALLVLHQSCPSRKIIYVEDHVDMVNVDYTILNCYVFTLCYRLNATGAHGITEIVWHAKKLIQL